MKTKVLLVDDEKLERVLIRKGYDWEANGFEIIGEASNGEEALEFFEIMEPDIVLTDINMPYMDGLMLTEKIKERSSKCRVIIITGYREFEYARNALKLGVKEFILKPVNINDIASIVEKLKRELKAEAGYNKEYKQLKESAMENREIIIESFLQRLVENRIEQEEAIRKLAMYGFDELQKKCICINIRPYIVQDSEKDSLIRSKKIQKLLIRNKYEYSISFIHYLCNVIIYFYGNEVNKAYNYALQIKEQINQELNIEVDVGIGMVQSGFSGISSSYKQSEDAISARVIKGRNSCITYEEFAQIKKANQESSDINWQDFIFSVENCFESKVDEYLNEFVLFIYKSGITDTGYLKLMAMNILAKAATVLTKHGKNLGQLIGEEYLYEQVSKIETVTEMKECLAIFIKQILEFSDSIRTKKSNKIVDQALEFIENNLYDQTLTLKTIAGKIFSNESYLSRVFKKEMGESLIEFITRKRIEKSIILLNTTDLKAYEIAEQVGISDPHYFSICFKKHVGVTIREYKKPKF